MSSPMFSVGGIASGLDTEAIISQLLQIERAPVNRFQQQQRQLRAVDDAWGKVVTDLSAFRAALTRTAGLAGLTTTTSSSPDAVAATQTGTAQSGSVTFTVSQLASAHQLAFDPVSSPDALVGTGSLTVNGTTIATDETTTLQQLATRINGADVGVSAQVLETAPGEHRLILGATATGTANAITIAETPSGLGAATQLRAAADAVLDLGAGVTVTRPSNAITDVVAGVRLDLRRAGETVTITTERDTDGAQEAIVAAVEALNKTLTTLKDLTAYDAESKRAGALQGDPTARKLAMDLRTAISSMVSDAGTYRHGSDIGISLTRDGLVQLDETKLGQALADDPDAVAALFSRAGSATGSVSYVRSTDRTTDGEYEVQVSTAATVAARTGVAYTPPGPTQPKVFRIVNDAGVTVNVTLDETHTSVAAAVAAINDALDAAGIASIRASDDGGAIRLADSRYGSRSSFEVISDTVGDDIYGLVGTWTGTDVAGSFVAADGTVHAATGNGRMLTGTGAADGLAVQVAGDATGAVGTVTVESGIAGTLGRVLTWAEGSDGSIQRARDALSSSISRLDTNIDAFEVRLELREETLRRQFAGLETAMSGLIAQGNWLASQLGASMGQ